MNNENIEKFINYASMTNNKNIELEARFGKYNRLYSNIRQDTFTKIYNHYKGAKKYNFIKDVNYDGDKRKRTEIGDPKDYVKNIFSGKINKIKEYTKLYTKLETVSNTYMLSKKQIFKPLEIKGVMKLTLVEEIIEKDTIPDYKTAIEKYVKNKFRCTVSQGSWNVDLTIVLIIDTKTKMQDIFYEVEVEYNNQSITPNIVSLPLSELKNHSDAILTIIDCAKNNKIDSEIQYGIFNQVSTLERNDLSLLSNSAYAVTEKADGERFFVYTDSKKYIFKFNPSNLILNKIPIGNASTKTDLYDTLLDGEMVIIDGKETYLGFDILFFKGRDLRKFNLIERLKYLEEAIKSLKQVMPCQSKKFYTDNTFINTAKIWNMRHKLFKYNLDGLIFSPIYGAYISNLPNLKWKDKHSIDVRILYNSKFDFTEFHSASQPRTKNEDGKHIITNEYIDRGSGNIYYTGRVNVNNTPNITKYKQFNLVNVIGSVGVKGRIDTPDFVKNMVDIIELEYDIYTKKWIYLRKRPDKESPNAYRTIVSVLDAIIDNITISEISKIKYKPSPYALMGSQCYSEIGFNFLTPNLESNICNYYTSTYNKILKGLSKDANSKYKTILVLGGDICILNAISQLYTNIIIVEPNCLEVYGTQKTEGYIGLKEYSNNKNIKATIIWGNINKVCGNNKKEQKELDSFIKKYPIDTVFINSFSDMFFTNKGDNIDKKLYESTISTIKQLSNRISNIILIYLDGPKIQKYLEKYDCLITKNKELHPLFRLNKSKNIIKIKRLQNSFVSQYQPILTDKQIQEFIKIIGKSKECKSLKYFHTEYIKSNIPLSEYDIIIADITNYTIVNT